MITVSNDIKYNASPPSTFTTQPEEDGCSKTVKDKSKSLPKSKTSPLLI